MATYPSNFLVKADVINEVDVYDQGDHNILKGEIIALQTYIGTNPHGNQTDLTTRLGRLMATDGTLAQSSGAFPASPNEGQLFWRRDTFTAYVYSSSLAAWQSLGQSLSNVLFDYSGFGLGGTTGLVSGTSGTAWWTYHQDNFRKIAGVSSVVVWAKYGGISGGAGNNGRVRYTINGSILATTTQAGAASTYYLTLDVSALDNGTYYNTVLEMQGGGAAESPILYGLKGFGI